MQRRDVLTALSASMLATLFPATSSMGQKQPTLGRIDTHVHIFNMSDIPWLQFLWNVHFEHFEEAHRFEDWQPSFWDLIAGGLALLTASLSNAGAPHAESERGDHIARLGLEAVREETRKRYLDATALSLQQLEDNPEEFARSYFPPFEGEYGPRRTEAFTEVDPLSQEINRQRATELLRAELAKELGELSHEEMAEKLLVDDSWLGRLSQFGLLLASYRVDNCDRLITTFAAGKSALFTPALVDFSGWLNGDARSGLHDQLLAMDVVQRTAAAPVAMLMPFNPWAQMQAEQDNLAGATPLDLLRQGFDRLGAIGIKIYPPMGFLPAGNETADLSYPDRAWAKFGEAFPRRLDEVLRQLYELCTEYDAPILTHSHNGNGAGVDFGLRAHPQHWETVITGWGFNSLRVSTAHFGSFDQDPKWEDTTSGLVVGGADNLFADLSYLRAVLPEYGTSQRATVVAHLQALPEQLWSHVVYGSDWHMLVQESGAERYPTLIEELLDDVGLSGDQKDLVLRRNAVRLFGLASGSRGRQRLDEYYSKANRQDLANVLAQLAES